MEAHPSQTILGTTDILKGSVVNRVPVSQRESSVLRVLLERSAYADPAVCNCTDEPRRIPFIELHQTVCAYRGLCVLNGVVRKFRERH